MNETIIACDTAIPGLDTTVIVELCGGTMTILDVVEEARDDTPRDCYGVDLTSIIANRWRNLAARKLARPR